MTEQFSPLIDRGSTGPRTIDVLTEASLLRIAFMVTNYKKKVPVMKTSLVLEKQKNTYIEFSNSHLMCEECSAESYSVNSPVFHLLDDEFSSTYVMPPMSKMEILEIAHFIEVAQILDKPLVYDRIPGFRIAIQRDAILESETFQIAFWADSQLIKLMSLTETINSKTVKVTKTNLNLLSQQIRKSSFQCR